jgi:hypothetical protein
LWSIGAEVRWVASLVAFDLCSLGIRFSCLWASLFFGGAQAIGLLAVPSALTKGRYLFNAAPLRSNLLIMVITCSPKKIPFGRTGRTEEQLINPIPNVYA